MNQNFSSMVDWYKHQQLRIGFVSPQQIRAWAQKMLPNGEIVGEVKKHYTFHYQTKKPEKDAFFELKKFILLLIHSTVKMKLPRNK